MKMSLLLAAAAVAWTGCTADAAIPSFPKQWSATTDSMVALYQGGTKKSDTTVCCAKSAPSCKLQLQRSAGPIYTDGVANRTRSDSAQGIIVNWYGKVNKQMLVAEDGTGGYTCQAYCPVTDSFIDQLAFDKSTKDKGSVMYNGKKVEYYQWFDRLIIIKMDEQDWYVDESGAEPVPVHNVEHLTPFGGAEIAFVTGDFSDFASTIDADHLFNITNVDSCPINPQGCGDDPNAPHEPVDINNPLLRPRLGHRRLNAPTSLYDAAEQLMTTEAALLTKRLPTEVSSSAPSLEGTTIDEKPWPMDFSATQTSTMLINQGGVEGDDDICCSNDAPGGQCQVQYQHLQGTRFHDYSNNRTRFESADGTISVDIFGTVLKSLDVVHNGTHDVCDSYCPIDPRDTLDSGKAYFLPDDAQDLGQVQIDGKTAERFHWNQTIFKIIVMQTSDLYADMTGDTVIPLFQEDHLTPFGMGEIGQSNVTWDNLVPAKQPAEKFDIHGIDTCPQNPNCGQQELLLKRIAARQYHTAAKLLQLQK